MCELTLLHLDADRGKVKCYRANTEGRQPCFTMLQTDPANCYAWCPTTGWCCSESSSSPAFTFNRGLPMLYLNHRATSTHQPFMIMLAKVVAVGEAMLRMVECCVMVVGIGRWVEEVHAAEAQVCPTSTTTDWQQQRSTWARNVRFVILSFLLSARPWCTHCIVLHCHYWMSQG